MNTKVVFFPLIALTCILASPMTSYAQDRTDILTQARASLDAKKWSEAEKLYTKAIALDPKESSAWTNRGFVRGQLNNLDGAIADSSSGLVALALSEKATKANRAIGFANRSNFWIRKGEMRRALIDATVACKADETNASAWLNRADALYALGNLKDAEICMNNMRNAKGNATRDFTEDGARQNALKNKPIDEKANTDAIFDVAYKAQNEGKTVEAMAGFSSVIEINPFVGGAWTNLGVMKANNNRYNEAIADYSMAVSLAGLGNNANDMALNLTNRGSVYTAQGRFAEAVNDLELAVKTKSDYTRAVDQLKIAREKFASAPSETLPVLERVKIYLANAKKFTGSILDHNTDTDASLKLIDQFNKDEPEDGMGWYFRGLVEEQIKSFLLFRIKTAFPFYDKAISLDPKIGEAYYRRAKIIIGNYSFSDEDRKRCDSDYDKAIELGVIKADLFDERAKKRIQNKDYSGARVDLNKALEMEPKNEDFLADRARTLELLKLWKEAISDRTAILEIKPDSGGYIARGETYLQLKDRTNAFADFDKAIALSPESADYYVDRAKAFRNLGEKSKALADYRKAQSLDSDYPTVLPDLSNAGVAEALRVDLNHILKKFSDSSKKTSDAILKNTLRKKVLNGEDRKPADILKEVAEHISNGIADEEDYFDRATVYFAESKLPFAIEDATTSIAFKMREGGNADTKTSFDNKQAKTFDLRGLALAKQGKFAESLSDFESAEKANPQKGEYPFHKGVACKKLGKVNESIAAFEKAVKLDSSLELAANYLAIMHDQRGVGYEKKKDFTAALAEYSAAAKSNPKAPEYPLHEGNAYFNLKKYDEAIAAYDRALKLKPDLKDATDNRAAAVKTKG